jgi:hypothetical protein
MYLSFMKLISVYDETLIDKIKGVFDGVALELGCTPGGSICRLVSFLCSSARPTGAKKGLSARLYSYAIFHRIAGARLRWARGKWLGGDFVLLARLAGANQTQK